MKDKLKTNKTWLMIGASLLSFGVLLGISLTKSDEKTIQIISTTQNLEPNTTLNAKHIQILTFPQEFVPPKFVQIKDRSLILGQKIKAKLPQGTPLCWYHLSEPDWRQEGLAHSVPKGKRAFPININHQFGFNILPGDFIDMIGYFRNPATNKEISKTILQKILVLKTKPTLIIEASPHEIEKILFAQKKGKLYLSLRNQEDNQRVSVLPETDFYAFVGIRPKGNMKSFKKLKNMPIFLNIPESQ